MNRKEDPTFRTIYHFKEGLVDLVRSEVQSIVGPVREALLGKASDLFFLYARLEYLARADDLRRDKREEIILSEVRTALPLLNFFLDQNIVDETIVELIELRGYIKGIVAPVLASQGETWENLMSVKFSLEKIISEAFVTGAEETPAEPMPRPKASPKASPRASPRTSTTDIQFIHPYECNVEYSSPKGKRYIWYVTASYFLMPLQSAAEADILTYRKSIKKIIDKDPDLKKLIQGSRKATYISEADAENFILALYGKVPWSNKIPAPTSEQIKRLVDMRGFIIKDGEKIYSHPAERYNCWANIHQIAQMDGSFTPFTINRRLKTLEESRAGDVQVFAFREGDVRYFWLTKANEHIFFDVENGNCEDENAAAPDAKIRINDITKRFDITMPALAKNKKLSSALGNPTDGCYDLAHVQKVFSEHGIMER